MVTTRNNPNDNVPNFEAMINVAVANALPNLTAALRTQITNDIRNGSRPSGGGGGDAIPHRIHVWIERSTKLKPLAFRSAATPVEAEDWITHMEKLFQVLGCPDNFKTRIAAFNLEGDALSWSKAHLRTQFRGDAFTDACTWVAFREIFYNRYFPAYKQQRYEREYGSICQLDRENSGKYMERLTRLASFVGAAAGDAQRQARHFKLRLLPVTSSYYMKARIRISGIEMVIGFKTGDRVNRRSGVVMTRVSMCIGVIRTRVLSIGVVRIEVMIQNDMIFGVRIRGSSGQRRSTETLPPPPLCATCGKPHPSVCYKATGGCFTCGSTQHKVKDCPQGKQKQSMSTDLARLPPTIGRVYATTRGRAAKTS
nr:zinc finger, CCHC-type, retrotransposon Gag domain protein [Tanacetum cinerariifolium]